MRTPLSYSPRPAPRCLRDVGDLRIVNDVHHGTGRVIQKETDPHLALAGPNPHAGDTVFFRTLYGDFDCAVAMYHDQGHVAAKMLGIWQGVNVTLGLSITHTLVEHGINFAHAGGRRGDPRSLLEALRLAATMAGDRLRATGSALQDHGPMNQPTAPLAFLLADDLSGAMEAGAAFLRHGWQVTLLLSDEPPAAAQPGELAVFSTETRNDSAGAAAAKTRNALSKWRAAGGRLVFKKIDSTARGAIPAELRVVCEESPPALVLLTTANPATQRTVRGGRVLVGGVPVEQTAFRDDPVSPVRTSDLRQMLKANGLPCAGLSLEALRQDVSQTVLMLEAIRRDGGRIVVCDAESEDDLRRIVLAGRAVAEDVLFVGSGALAAALAESQPCPSPGAAATRRVTADSLLVLCGSRHEASRRQLDGLARQAGIRVLEAVCDTGDTEALLKEVAAQLRAHTIAVVRVSVQGLAGGEDARKLLLYIRELGPQLLQAAQPGAVFLTGGETARAFCTAAGGRQLTLLQEFEPGVVAAELSPAVYRTSTIITKPGGYGDAQTLIRLKDILHPITLPLSSKPAPTNP